MEKSLTPEMRSKLNSILDSLVKPEKKDGFEYALKSFLSEEFTPLMADSLVKKYKLLSGIRDVDSLEKSQKILFAETMIQKIFGRIRNQQEINTERLHFYIKLSVTEGSKKLSQMLEKKVFMDVFDIKKMSTSSLLEFVEMMKQEVFIIKTELKDFVEGTAYVLLFRRGTELIADTMTSKMEQEKPSIGFDNIKISAVQEFLNMMISSYSDAIANILQGKLYFSILQIDPFDMPGFINDVKTQIFEKGENAFEKIFTTSLKIEIGSMDKVEGLVFLMLEKSPDAMKTMLNKSMSEVNLGIEQEEPQQQIVEKGEIKKKNRETKNIKMELAMFMDEYLKGRDGNEIIEFVMAQMGIPDFEDLNLGQKEEFAEVLLDTAFSGLSIYRRGIIKSALYDALGIDLDSGGEMIDTPKQSRVKEKKHVDKDSNIYKMIK